MSIRLYETLKVDPKKEDIDFRKRQIRREGRSVISNDIKHLVIFMDKKTGVEFITFEVPNLFVLKYLIRKNNSLYWCHLKISDNLESDEKIIHYIWEHLLN